MNKLILAFICTMSFSLASQAEKSTIIKSSLPQQEYAAQITSLDDGNIEFSSFEIAKPDFKTSSVVITRQELAQSIEALNRKTLKVAGVGTAATVVPLAVALSTGPKVAFLAGILAGTSAVSTTVVLDRHLVALQHAQLIQDILKQQAQSQEQTTSVEVNVDMNEFISYTQFVILN